MLINKTLAEVEVLQVAHQWQYQSQKFYVFAPANAGVSEVETLEVSAVKQPRCQSEFVRWSQHSCMWDLQVRNFHLLCQAYQLTQNEVELPVPSCAKRSERQHTFVCVLLPLENLLWAKLRDYTISRVNK